MKKIVGTILSNGEELSFEPTENYYRAAAIRAGAERELKKAKRYSK